MKRFLNIIVLSLFALALNAASAFSVEAPKVTEAELKKADKIYFKNCAGCHGVLRNSGMGPSLLPAKTLEDMGTQKIEKIVTEGTEHGMPAFGAEKLLNEEEINLVARYVQHDPNTKPPGMPMADIKASWKVLVPVKDRPTKPENGNWENFFGVISKKAHMVTIIDGDSKAKVVELKNKIGAHSLRVSKSGRYLYIMQRRGEISLIDIWAKTPNVVAQVRTCIRSSSAETSKFKGYEDKVAIVGCNWPSHIVSLDGQTLEPLQLISTSSDPAYNENQGVVGIAASHSSPEWVVNAGGTGSVWVVDYSSPAKLKITKIATKKPLSDGGWDNTKRYFMATAKERDAMVIIDTKTKKKVAEFKIGAKPEHPSRSANWVDPKYGPVSATVSGKGAKIFIWGSDPEGHPDHAWKIVQTIDFASAIKKGDRGGLFYLKSHPKSKHVWVDFFKSPKKKVRQSICVFNKDNITAKPQCARLTKKGKILHTEYNKAGDEVWVSVFDNEGQIIVFDDTADKIKIKTRIKDIHSPAGKFNIYNHMNDIY